MTTGRITDAARCGADYGAHVAEFGELPTLSAEDVLSAIDASGLRGRGGAWFPTGRKMKSVAANAERRRRRATVICNAMEGEPSAAGDEWILTNLPHLLIDGVELAARVVDADRAYVAVHGDAPTVPIIREALAQRPARHVRIQLIQAPPRYVASEESALAHLISGGSATPVYGERPYQHGVKGHPTLVNNAETLTHVALIARHGAEWFRQVGTADAPGTTLVSVGGSVRTPGVVEVATGTPIRALLDRVGGPTDTVTGMRTGGFGGTWAGPGLLDATWDPDKLKALGVAAGAGILRVLTGDHCGLVETALTLDYLAGESAGQCGVCAFGLSATSAEFAALADLHTDHDRVGRLTRLLAAIPRRGGCSMPDGAVRMAQSALSVFAEEVQAHVTGHCTATDPLPAGKWTPVPVPRHHPVVAQGRRFA